MKKYKVYDNELISLEDNSYIFKSYSQALEAVYWLEANAEAYGDSQHYFYIKDLTTGEDVY